MRYTPHCVNLTGQANDQEKNHALRADNGCHDAFLSVLCDLSKHGERALKTIEPPQYDLLNRKVAPVRFSEPTPVK